MNHSPREDNGGGAHAPIYLDYLSTTPLCDEAVAAMESLLAARRTPAAAFGNPGSAHVFGASAQAVLAKARQEVANLISCRADEVVFESGSTESINHAIKGTLKAAPAGRVHVVTSTVEHPAVTETIASLVGSAATTRVTRVPVDAQGRVDPQAVADAVEVGRTALVTIMLANNETGAVNDWSAIAKRVRAKDKAVVLHTDASQAVGKIPVDVDCLGVDLLTIAAHKMYGPKGIGALFVRAHLALARIADGAGQEHGQRAGTENVLLAAGFGAACTAAVGLPDLESTRALRDELLAWLKEHVRGLELNGPTPAEFVLPGALSVSVPGVLGPAAVSAAAAMGVCFSAGAACHAHDKPSPSKVLMAMPGMTEERALGTVRISVGRYTTREEIARAKQVLKIVLASSSSSSSS